MDLLEITTKLNSQKKCIEFLESKRWPEGAICPYCLSSKSSCKKHRHTCNSCGRSFSVTVGTVFHNSKLPLIKWFLAIHLMVSAKKGISSRQLARHLSINKDTAWSIQQRIRKAMTENEAVLRGMVEIDETFIGGKRSNKHLEVRAKENKALGTGYKGEVPVLGMFERSGKIITKVINQAKGSEIIPKMKEWISSESTVITDGFGGYFSCSEHFHSHQILNHSKNVRRYGKYHMNNIEGFWSMFKRALVGQYHKVSSTYLQAYLDEMTFKYNNRKEVDYGFNTFIKGLLSNFMP